MHFKAQCIAVRNINTFEDSMSQRKEESERRKKKTPINLLKWIKENEFQTIYPNIDIALRMCVCTAVTNCSGERSFSTLKRIKNYLRTTTSQERFNALALLNIENELLNSIDFDLLIDKFSQMKCRRKTL